MWKCVARTAVIWSGSDVTDYHTLVNGTIQYTAVKKKRSDETETVMRRDTCTACKVVEDRTACFTK